MRRKNRAWLRRHSYSFFSSLGVLLQHRIGTLMTTLVLGIAMFLPLGLYITLSNLERANLQQDDWNVVTVYFKTGITAAEIEQFSAEVEEKHHPKAVLLISPEQGMAEFQDTSGFGESLTLLGENPLPWVMQISPQSDAAGEMERSVTELSAFLQTNNKVELIQFDYKWLQRLGLMMEFGSAMVSMLMLVFGLAVVVVVANTIRLDVASRSEEIEILALVGAGNAFVRQPFLYTGFWYGLVGGVLAVLLLGLSLLYLGGPLGLLLETYGAEFKLHGLNVESTLLVLFGGGLLGWLGAWISVQRYLRILRVGGSLGRR